MTATDNKELFHKYQDALRHPEQLDALLSPDFVADDQPEGRRSLTDLKQFRALVNMAVPDQTVTVDYIVAEADLVSAHITHMTLPTGERVTFSGLEIVGIKDGRIGWRRGYGDDTFHELKKRMGG